MKIGFIGAGKVGFSLGKFLADGKVPVTGYYSRQRESAQEAAAFTGTKAYDDLEQLLTDSDALFLTVPDQAIAGVYKQLTAYDMKGKYICHCSGAMTAEEAFCGIALQGAYGFSIHPLFPISSKYESYRELSDAFFCLEAEEQSKQYLCEWEKLLTSLGCRVRGIASDKKVSYHAACAIASNLVCGLLQESMELLIQCGFSKEEALSALKPLAFANLTNALAKGPTEALTGPMERGDVATVAKHLACLNEDEKGLYLAVSQKLLEMAKRRHMDTSYEEMEQLLVGQLSMGKGIEQ